MRRVALVTDSTSMLSEDVVAEHGLVVVPLQVIIGSTPYAEGSETSADMVAEALRAGQPVSTSRPAPEAFVSAYENAAASGAEAVVSIHLSSEISGTFESAQLAAKQVSVPVEVVDSRQVGLGTGFAVLAAAEAREAGEQPEGIAGAAHARAEATSALFYVDTLEYLRRGGRIGAAAKLLGSALAVKPLLRIEDGRIVPLEKVRTTGRALSRIEDLAVEVAGDRTVDVGVAHLATPERAEVVAAHLRERIAGVRELVVGEVGAVIGAHVGPGMVAVVVSPLA
ncbi:MAG: DegV family EDD domain-containing protein [Propionibacteriales bacterium]|nr:DegV family EDD domain-containing protein [Propionibacteriales bacterium]